MIVILILREAQGRTCSSVTPFAQTQKQVLRSLRSHQDDIHLLATRANVAFTGGACGVQPDTRSQWRDITSVSPRSAKSR